MSGTSQDQVRDPRPLFGWLRGFLIAYIICALIVGAGNSGFYLISMGDPNYVPITPFELALTLGFGGAAIIMIGIFITCVVLTCRITFRMMKNLRAAGSTYPSISPGWAVGWYFIPIANLFMPMKAVSEIWGGTFDQIGETGKSPGGLIGLWWSCWIFGNICDSVAERLAGGGGFSEPTMPSAQMLYAAVILWLMGTLLSVLAALFMINLFGKLSRAQQQMAQAGAF